MLGTRRVLLLEMFRFQTQLRHNGRACDAQIDDTLGFGSFANGLRYFGNETIISPLVNRAINVFRELVNDAFINTLGIVLNIGVQFASIARTQNIISFIASHAPSDVLFRQMALLFQCPQILNVSMSTIGRWAIGRNSITSGLESFPGVSVTRVERDPLGGPGSKR